MASGEPHPDGPDGSRRTGVRRAAVVVPVAEGLPLPDAPGGTNAGGAGEGAVPAEAPGPVQSKVDVQDQGVVEVQEQVFAVRLGGKQGMPVQQRRTPLNLPWGLETASTSPAKTSPNCRASLRTEWPSGTTR